MTSPPIDRSLDSLHPMFRAALEAWLMDASDKVKHVDFRVTETRRTLARQDWLYAQGRTPPFLYSPVVTWTRNSRHRYGLAADLAMIRKDSRLAIWEVSSWKWLYEKLPPERYGLRHLAPAEFVHLELRYADQAIAEAPVVGLVHT